MKELIELREKLDKLDTELLRFLGERRGFTKSVAEYKKENNVVIVHPERKKSMIEERVEKGSDFDLDKEFIQKFFRFIIDESIKYQKTIKSE